MIYEHGYRQEMNRASDRRSLDKLRHCGQPTRAAAKPKRCPMNFVEAISSCFRNYANFSGRAVRSEYWFWYLFVAIVLIVFGAINGSLYPGPLEMGPFSYVTTAVVLALILPSLAVSVRRLHDIDRTGWWVLIVATAIGTLVLIYWACLPGTSGPNRFR
jgi:uncharacterized membrane protein YhaH (DUF805 family)